MVENKHCSIITKTTTIFCSTALNCWPDSPIIQTPTPRILLTSKHRIRVSIKYIANFEVGYQCVSQTMSHSHLYVAALAVIVIESELIGKTGSRRGSRTWHPQAFVCVAAETKRDLRLLHVFVETFLCS